jgi:tryptophan synthase alpha chain
MSQISDVFQNPRRKALVPYVTAGYPDAAATMKAVPLLAENGADIIEIGIPFSDPLADGATIQNASFRALQRGMTTRRCLEMARELRKQVRTPLVFMTYLNPVFHYGYERFCADCAESGISGLIVPDLPPEEGMELEAFARQRDIDVIYLLAPNSTGERIRAVAEKSSGFIYLVSVTGVTGARESLPEALEGFIARVRKATRQPLCVGFGISTAAQARQIAQIADGVIIGSRIIRLMESDASLKSVGEFTREIRQSLDSLE